MSKNSVYKSAAAEPPSDFVWGAEAIGRVIGRTATQVYHLHASGALDGAVTKTGHRTLLGSRRALAQLLPGTTDTGTTENHQQAE
jgi:Protein of unknown function (DUF3853)